MSFHVFIRPIFGEIIARHGVRPDPRKLEALPEMPPNGKKVIASIPWNSELPE